MKHNLTLTKFSCYVSYVVQAIVVNLAPLFFVIFRTEYGLSFAGLAFIVLFTFGVQLAVDLASIKLLDLFGYKSCAIGANACACIGILMMSILPSFIPALPALIISVFFYSLGGGLIEVVINPVIEAIPTDSKSASFSILHSFYSWGQTSVILVTTALLFLVGNDRYIYLPLIWASVPFFNALIMIKAPFPHIDDAGHSLSNAKKLLKSPAIYVFLLLMICGGSTEMVISQWASYFAERGLGVGKIIGDLLGPCMFALMMALGRTYYGFWGRRYDILKGLIVCSFLSVIAYLGIGFIHSPILVMIFFALAGIASSLLWPGTLSVSSEAIPHGGTAMFALLAFSGDLGCSLGPWINGIANDIIIENKSLQIMTSLGFTPEQASLRSAIIVSAIFPTIMLISLIILSHAVKKQNRQK